MTERLIVRVTLRDENEQAAAEGNRGVLPKPRRGWIVGGAVVVGLSIVIAAALMMDFSGNQSIQGGVTAPEARMEDRGPLESGGHRSMDAGTFPVEPAVRPTLERDEAPAQPAIRPSTADTGVESDAKGPVPPPVVARKPVEKPEPAVPSVAARKPVEKPESAVPPVAVAPERTEMATKIVAQEGTGPAAASGITEKKEAEPIAPAITDSRVLRAQLSAGVKGKEPTARLQPPVQVTGRGDRTIYYFSEVRDFDGQTVFHRWEREGKVIASVPFKIGGQRWRFYSRKTINPDMTGDWRVVLTDSTGNKLAGSTFSVR